MPISIQSLPTQTSQRWLKGSARWSPLTPGSQRNPRKWDGLTSTVSSARSMGAHSRVTTHVTAVASIRTVLQSKIVGAQVSPSSIRKEWRALMSHSWCVSKSKRPFANMRARTRNVMPMTGTATAAPMIVPEGAGQIALGNYVGVKNIN